jgi:uncharacterized protein YndB with AHSA1/START domain
MIKRLFTGNKDLRFERSYPAPIGTVWQAWTQPDMLREWWGPEKTTVSDCEIDLQLDGEIRVITEATEAMGKYAGTRWPMVGSFTLIEEPTRLAYEARSWTEGEEAGSTIRHHNDLTLTERDGTTTAKLHVAILEIGPKAKMAAFGMKWGYKQQLDQLDVLLSAQR